MTQNEMKDKAVDVFTNIDIAKSVIEALVALADFDSATSKIYTKEQSQDFFNIIMAVLEFLQTAQGTLEEVIDK